LPTEREKEMAKYRHRIFEMYDFRDEAVHALTPKTASPVPDAIDSESWDFKFLNASRAANVMHVGFKEDCALRNGAAYDLREDFAQLTDKLSIDSKVLLDFTGLNSFSAASIDMLVIFSKNLRHKGSRMALCCLNPTVRDSFFVAR
jgi:STAS domain-containing protein